MSLVRAIEPTLDSRRFKAAATVVVAVAVCLICVLLAQRAVLYQRSVRGAGLNAAGDPVRAFPYLVRAAGAGVLDRLNAAPLLELGDVATRALDDPVFRKYHPELTPAAAARLAFASYAEALQRRPTSSTALAGMADLVRKGANLRLFGESAAVPTVTEVLEGEPIPSADRLVEAAYRRAIEMEPANYFWYAYLADFHRERGRQEMALPLYEKAIELMPDLGWHYYLGASGPLAPELFDTARRGLERALATNPVALPEKIESNLGDLYARQRDYDGALQHYRRAVELAPDPSKYLYQAANVLGMQGRPDEAVTYFRRAMARETLGERRTIGALSWLGRLYLERGAHREAAEALSRARALQPGSYAIRVDLGRAWQGLGETERAESEYRQAISLDPTQQRAYALLIGMYRAEGDFAKAIPLARRLAEMYPEDTKVKALLDALYGEMGKPPDRG